MRAGRRRHACPRAPRPAQHPSSHTVPPTPRTAAVRGPAPRPCAILACASRPRAAVPPGAPWMRVPLVPFEHACECPSKAPIPLVRHACECPAKAAIPLVLLASPRARWARVRWARASIYTHVSRLLLRGPLLRGLMLLLLLLRGLLLLLLLLLHGPRVRGGPAASLA